MLLVRLPSVAALLGLAVTAATGNYAIAQPLALLAVALAPALLPRRFLYPGTGDQPPEETDPGDGGGGGPGPDPGRPSDGPRGGLPLPDAEPAGIRVRDHDRPVLTRPRHRRGPREPQPKPAPNRPASPRR